MWCPTQWKRVLQVFHVRRVVVQRSENEWPQMSTWSFQMRSKEDRLIFSNEEWGRSCLQGGPNSLFEGEIKHVQFPRRKLVELWDWHWQRSPASRKACAITQWRRSRSRLSICLSSVKIVFEVWRWAYRETLYSRGRLLGFRSNK